MNNATKTLFELLHKDPLLPNELAEVVGLIGHGAEVQARDPQNNCTPLSIAAITGHAFAIHPLLAAGAEIDARSNGSTTPLDLAILSDHSDVVQLLLKTEAQVEARNIEGQTPLQAAIWNLLLNKIITTAAGGLDVGPQIVTMLLAEGASVWA